MRLTKNKFARLKVILHHDLSLMIETGQRINIDEKKVMSLKKKVMSLKKKGAVDKVILDT